MSQSVNRNITYIVGLVVALVVVALVVVALVVVALVVKFSKSGFVSK